MGFSHGIMGFSNKNTGVGCHFLHQGIFPIKPGSSAWEADSLSTEPPGKPVALGALTFLLCVEPSAAPGKEFASLLLHLGVVLLISLFAYLINAHWLHTLCRH